MSHSNETDAPPRGALEPGTWLLSLPASSIADGVHPDFAIGERAEFAFEFRPETTIFWERPVTHCEHVQLGRYLVSGKCLLVRPDFWILDFGLKAYHHGPAPEGLAPGEAWTGRISLGVDAFLYRESIHAEKGVPPLAYRFEVMSLWKNAAPFIEVPFPAVGKFRERDRERLRYEPIARTDARKDDEGEAEYLVLAGLVELLPTRPGFVGPE
jgi:hypothetical protein